jgi:glucose/arabinose dehydrogenase
MHLSGPARLTALAAATALALVACGGASSDPVVLDPVGPTATPGPSPEPTGPGDVAVPEVVETVATGLAAPWGLAFLPDGSALVSERDSGRILAIEDGQVSEVGVVPGVNPTGEGGLLGLAVREGAEFDGYVYAYLTTSQDNRVVRLPLVDGGLGEPEVLLDGIPASRIHNGGRLAFGPDRMLYATTGDAADTATSQDSGSLAGKILRLTPDGQVPPDNPEPGSPVLSSGHRNVQGIAWDADGTLWASEFGANTWDELNLIEPGADYGWPRFEGAGGSDEGFVDPLVQWPTAEASPSGIAVVDGTVFLASLRGQRLWAVPVEAGRAGEPEASFTDEFGRLRTVQQAPDGSLWLITNNTDGRGSQRDGDDRIVRLEVG